MRWRGSVAIVTGASRGIGRAVALEAARRGARVGLVARTREDLETVRKEAGGDAAIATADVADRAQTDGAVAALAASLGPPDILVNNAGAGSYGAFADLPVEEFERMIRLNYLSALYATKAVLPSMIERGRGHLVFVASIAGRIGAPFESAYSASKFALAGLAETLAIELRPRGIGVSIVNPGPVRTDFFAARGAPYKRSSPKPVSAERVARDVISVVERDKLERYVPRWLGGALAARVLMPAMYRFGTARSYRDELRQPPASS